MSAPPFMPLYVADYLADTYELTTQQHGAHLLLLMAIWRHGALPMDDAKLAKHCKLGPRTWASIGPAILQKLTVEDGRVTSKRLVAERKRYESRAAINSSRASLGGVAKSLKYNNVTPASSTPQAVLNECLNVPNQNQNQNQKELASPKRESNSRSIDIDFESWWSAYPRKTSKGHARTAFAKALRKTTLAELIAATHRYARSVEGSDPKFTPHPATWLNGERWLDQPKTTNPKYVGFV